jgi:outer membrane protein assembly factor BamB
MRHKGLYLLCFVGSLALGCGDEAAQEPGGATCVSGACMEGENNGEPFEEPDPMDWTSFRNGPLRTGYAQGSVVGTQVEEVWRQDDFLVLDYGAAKPSPAVWGDVLYMASDGGEVVAFDRHTGQRLWGTQLIDGGNGIHSSPALTEAQVLVGTYRGRLHALDRETGQELWNYKIGNVIGSSPVYVPEDHAIYVSHEIPKEEPLPGGGYVTRNDPVTGEALWVSPKLEHWPHASVAVDPARGVVAVGANDGVFHAYDTETGEELWQRDFEPGEELDPGTADIKTTAAVSSSRGLLLFGTWDRNFYALRTESGEEAWRFSAQGIFMGSAAVDEENGRVFIGAAGNDGHVYALDLDTGAELWRLHTGGSVLSSPALSGDRRTVVVGSSSGALFAIDAATGQQRWRYETDGPITSSPALVGDKIYIAAKNGALYALRSF